LTALKRQVNEMEYLYLYTESVLDYIN